MSDARRLRLEVVLAAVDKATRPLRNLMNANNDLARAVKATRAQLRTWSARRPASTASASCRGTRPSPATN